MWQAPGRGASGPVSLWDPRSPFSTSRPHRAPKDGKLAKVCELPGRRDRTSGCILELEQ